MILLYAYIQKFKNYVNQEIVFDNSYKVTFSDGELSITELGNSAARNILRGDYKPNNLHLLVGKTGSGKTNLLQLIGMKYDIRTQRKWDGEDDSYFLLYKIGQNEFFLEICDVEMKQFPVKKEKHSLSIPEVIKENAARMDTVRTVRFRVEETHGEKRACSEFTEISEYGYDISTPDEKVRNMGIIINSYDINAFIKPPYPDEKENCEDMGNDWIGRLVIPYHRTSLWEICDYIREYSAQMEPGDTKRQATFVLSTHNFADKYPIQLPGAIRDEYWTFSEIKRDEELAYFDEDARERISKRKKKNNLSYRQMFIHDLWTDYAIYLRKWIEKIHSYNDSFDPSALPDGEKISIVKKCIRLAEYIDRIDNGKSHGVLWQIMNDIKGIGKILEQIDEKYFTVDTFSIPVTEMVRGKNKELFKNLFERMEQYIPDDAGIFTAELLPYEFTYLSTGEYQYAKVLGGLEEYMKMTFSGEGRKKRDKIVLLDEPEAYMHPELARQFIAKLLEITKRYDDETTLQIIIGTHSPLMMSDVLAEEITRINIDKRSGNAIVKNGSDKEYFGANIHAILSDSFFLEYTIGEYARSYLQNAYDQLYCCRESICPVAETQNYVHTMRLLLPYIGDELIYRAFEILLNELEERDVPVE
ncbi:MAG: AAA family ATPase [Lachnospiraceae bacterium]